MKLRIERENKPQQNNFDQLEQEITQVIYCFKEGFYMYLFYCFVTAI